MVESERDSRRSPGVPTVVDIEVPWDCEAHRFRVLGVIDNGRFRVDLVEAKDFVVCRTRHKQQELGGRIRGVLKEQLQLPVGMVHIDRLVLEVAL